MIAATQMEDSRNSHTPPLRPASTHARSGLSQLQLAESEGSSRLAPPNLSHRLASLRSQQGQPLVARLRHASHASIGQAALEIRSDLTALSRAYEVRRCALDAMRTRTSAARLAEESIEHIADELASALRGARESLRSGQQLSTEVIQRTDRLLARAIRRGGGVAAGDDFGAPGEDRSRRDSLGEGRADSLVEGSREEPPAWNGASPRLHRRVGRQAGPSNALDAQRGLELEAAHERMRRRGVTGAPGVTSASLLDRGSSMFGRLQQMREAVPSRVVSNDEAPPPPIDEHVLRALRPAPLIHALSDVCSVCLEPMRVGDRAITLDCSHTFHGKCLLPWLLRCACCPLCKAKVQGPAAGQKNW